MRFTLLTVTSLGLSCMLAWSAPPASANEGLWLVNGPPKRVATVSPADANTSKTRQLIKNWGEVIDPDGDCRVVQDKDDIVITIPKTHHDMTHANQQIKLNAPRILQAVDGDFTIKVKVPVYPLPGAAFSSGGGQSFVSAGLLIWQDEKNFIRLERAAMGAFNLPFVWFEKFKDGKMVKDKYNVLTDTDTGLQIVRQGNRFTFLYDQNGDDKHWTEFYSEQFAGPALLHVGVLAINSTVREFPARLSALQVQIKK